MFPHRTLALKIFLVAHKLQMYPSMVKIMSCCTTNIFFLYRNENLKLFLWDKLLKIHWSTTVMVEWTQKSNFVLRTKCFKQNIFHIESFLLHGRRLMSFTSEFLCQYDIKYIPKLCMVIYYKVACHA